MIRLLLCCFLLFSAPLYSKSDKKVQLKDLRPDIKKENIEGRFPQSVPMDTEQNIEDKKRYQRIQDFSERMMEYREPFPTMGK